MGSLRTPPGIKLNPHLLAIVITPEGRIIMANATRQHGIWVWDEANAGHNLLDDLPAERAEERAKLWGDPELLWRPSDGQLLLASVVPNEGAVMLLPVPGIKRAV